MRNLSVVTCLVALSVALSCSTAYGRAASKRAPKPDAAERSYTPFELSLVWPLHIFHGPRKTIGGLGINLIHGSTTRMYGLQLGGLINWVKEDAAGLQLSGFLNVTLGDFTGIQLAGMVNVGESCRGLCVAPGNLHRELLGVQIGPLAINGVGKKGGVGAQLSLLLNYSRGDLDGLMISVGNYARGDFRGVQLGLGNITNVSSRRTSAHIVETWRGRTVGLQLSALNMAAELEGGQIGGLGNFAFVSSTGVQLGAVNYARSVKGVQIGIVNICKELKGLQIGAINIATRATIPVLPVVNFGF